MNESNCELATTIALDPETIRKLPEFLGRDPSPPRRNKAAFMLVQQYLAAELSFRDHHKILMIVKFPVSNLPADLQKLRELALAAWGSLHLFEFMLRELVLILDNASAANPSFDILDALAASGTPSALSLFNTPAGAAAEYTAMHAARLTPPRGIYWGKPVGAAQSAWAVHVYVPARVRKAMAAKMFDLPKGVKPTHEQIAATPRQVNAGYYNSYNKAVDRLCAVCRERLGVQDMQASEMYVSFSSVIYTPPAQ